MKTTTKKTWLVTVYDGKNQARILRFYTLRAANRAALAALLINLGHHGDAYSACEV